MVTCPSLSYLFASLYVYSEQSPAVVLGTAGDAAHLRGRGQMCWLQKEAKVKGKYENVCYIHKIFLYLRRKRTKDQ